MFFLLKEFNIICCPYKKTLRGGVTPSERRVKIKGIPCYHLESCYP